MKHIKKYENIEVDYKFDVGDLVVCVISDWPVVNLEIGSKYIVEHRKNYNGINFYAVSNEKGEKIYNLGKLSYFGEKVFMFEIEYDEMKYNL